jgi:putative holliday junction resolvase
MAIDYGTKRVGLAVTDKLQLIASALDTVPTNNLLLFLRDYFSKEEVECVVVGEPKHMDNEPSESEQHIKGFVRAFIKQFPAIPVYRADERFTSKMAFRSMIDSGVKKKDRRDKGMVDQVSATIILQSFLEQKNNKI